MITFGYTALPLGRQIYDAGVAVDTDHPIPGSEISVTTLAIGIFNGVI